MEHDLRSDEKGSGRVEADVDVALTILSFNDVVLAQKMAAIKDVDVQRLRSSDVL